MLKSKEEERVICLLKNKNISFVVMIVMGIVSVSTFWGFSFAGVAVIIGIVFFFINTTREDDSLRFKSIGTHLRDKSLWFWIALPVIVNVVCNVLAIFFLPDFFEHIKSRTDFIFSVSQLLFVVLQFAFFALGEEIAWRGFFQKQLNKQLPIIPTLIVTSILFSLCHFQTGDVAVVSYDLFFIFINSIIYGIIFYKTNNAWISAISHFIANLSAFIMMSFL